MVSRNDPIDGVLSARSLLFVPGSRPDRFAKAAASGADVVVCDLEDGVAPDQRVGARAAVAAWLRHGGRAVVRCNALGTAAFEADLAALARVDGLAGLMVPKSEDPAILAEIGSLVGRDIAVVALIETAVGVIRAPEIAASGVARLAFGHLDYAADVGCSPDIEALLLARSTLVVASPGRPPARTGRRRDRSIGRLGTGRSRRAPGGCPGLHRQAVHPPLPARPGASWAGSNRRRGRLGAQRPGCWGRRCRAGGRRDGRPAGPREGALDPASRALPRPGPSFLIPALGRRKVGKRTAGKRSVG
ncbi:MAG: citrate lyase subunit beta / citryl-CoA lyase [Micromonosporaceae bacterium]|nr:citrate lyase subunit beta / citryl-CoA lyase [Micromonosporaceae bacterium]